jgi:hypothetical protein
MKILFIGRMARPQLSPEEVLAIMKGSKEFHDQKLKDGTYDCIFNFIGGGGIGIANVDSVEAAYDLLSDYPARLLMDWEVHPLADTEHAVQKAISRLEAAIELQKQGGS